MSEIITLYSTNDEEYSESDEYQLVSDMVADFCEVGYQYYSAKFTKIEAKQIANVDSILERWDEDFFDTCGLEDTPFDDVSKEAKEELETLLVAWIDKHVFSSKKYYEYVGPTSRHHITAEMMKEIENDN